MKLIQLLLLITILCMELTAQDPGREEPGPILFQLQGRAFEIRNAFGFGNGVSPTASSFMDANPAALSTFDGLTAGLSFEVSTRIDTVFDTRLLEDLSLDQTNRFKPNSAGIVVPIQSARLSAGITRRHSELLKFGPIQLTTQGDTFEPEIERSIHTITMGLAYPLIRFAAGDSYLSIGVQANGNVLRARESIPRAEQKIEEIAWSGVVGAMFAAGERLAVGVAYETAFTFSGEIVSDGFIFLNDTLVSTDIISKFEQELPGRFTTSAYFNTPLGVRLNASYAYVSWDDLTSDSRSNQHDVYLGLSANLLPQVKGSVGMYTTDRSRKEALEFFDTVRGFRAVYLSAGAVIDVGPIEVDVLVADSHLLSETTRQQTVIRVGTGLKL